MMLQVVQRVHHLWVGHWRDGIGKVQTPLLHHQIWRAEESTLYGKSDGKSGKQSSQVGHGDGLLNVRIIDWSYFELGTIILITNIWKRSLKSKRRKDLLYCTTSCCCPTNVETCLWKPFMCDFFWNFTWLGGILLWYYSDQWGLCQWDGHYFSLPVYV